MRGLGVTQMFSQAELWAAAHGQSALSLLLCEYVYVSCVMVSDVLLYVHVLTRRAVGRGTWSVWLSMLMCFSGTNAFLNEGCLMVANMSA
jgi:hypothetical protein